MTQAIKRLRTVKVCARCGSHNVKVDAWAEWHSAAQCWEIAQLFDTAHCDDCDGETTIVDKAAQS